MGRRADVGELDEAARRLLTREGVKDTLPSLTLTRPHSEVNLVDLVEDMLFQRAQGGIRPVLYLSSYTDFECSMMMLLDEPGEAQWSIEQQPVAREVGYHVVTN